MKASGIHLYAQATEGSDSLVMANRNLVKRVALHLKVRLPPFIEFDDLLQAGMIGLIEASRSYKAEKGIPFEGFARLRIKGAMIDHVRRQSYLPRSAVAAKRSHSEATQSLAGELGRAPTQQELADFMDMDINDLQKERYTSSQFETHSIEDMTDAVDSLPDTEDSIPDIALEKAQLSESLVRAIEELPEREKLILSLYYNDELTLKEIGEIVGVGESRISQILAKTAKSLRQTLQ